MFFTQPEQATSGSNVMSPNEAPMGPRGPVGRQTSEQAHEDLQTILGAAPVQVAALTQQVSGYILLLHNVVVVDQPRGFVSRSVDLGSPPLGGICSNPLGVSSPGPQSSVRPPRGPHCSLWSFPSAIHCSVAHFIHLTFPPLLTKHIMSAHNK